MNAFSCLPWYLDIFSVYYFQVNGMMLADKKVFVGRFKSRSDRMREFGERAKQYTNLYIKNLPESWDDDKLLAEFKEFGDVLSSKVSFKDVLSYYRLIRNKINRRDHEISLINLLLFLKF